MTDRELLQQALDMLDDINQCSLPPTGIPLPAEIDHVMEALRARLAQPEPWVKTYSGGKPNYTEPKEWVGLTDETYWEMWVESPSDVLRFAHAIEAKLRKKNGG